MLIILGKGDLRAIRTYVQCNYVVTKSTLTTKQINIDTSPPGLFVNIFTSTFVI